ncbi:MAG TPA: DUF3300 domain-containing protein [Azonexus sp.]
MVTNAHRLTVSMLAGAFALTACYTTPPPPPPPAATVTVTTTTKQVPQGKNEQLVAPIALYPDALVAQILMASTYPLEVVEAARWSKENPKLQGSALESAMQSQNWDPSVKSLTAFPQVLQMMNDKLSWMQQLGDAFLADQKGVMDAIQRLRKAAYDQGNLKSGKELNVRVEPGATTTETIIRIEPVTSTIVYVPTYDPTYIYGPWPYAAYPPYYYYPPGYYGGAAFWGFTAGVIVGGALWGDCDWHGGDVHIDHHKYNNFNRTNISGDRKWNHNVDHRRGVGYRDQAVANRFNRPGASTRDMQAREQFRGRGDSVGNRQAGGFGGVDAGNRARDFGNRGAASRGSSFGGGGFGGGGRGGFGGGGGRGGRR